ncbi:MATE family efflux transporter [Bacillus thuringiensis]|uniref:MATE family efflux transporter n=1 Tax=Bacillus thuringiensis TaxID=1428 RepID=UPI002FBE95D8
MQQQNFTTGDIWKQLFLFSTPIMVTNLLQVSYQFIDSLWVGNLLGANGLGAIAVSSTVIFTILSFIIGINNATLTIFSQQKGMKDREGLTSFLNAFIVLLTSLSIGLGITGYLFSEDILVLLGTPPEMLREANAYLQINFIGILFLFGYNFIGTVLRALGDSRTPIQFVIIAVILNTILDPLFIHVLGLGIDGAAYATILSEGVAFAYGMFLIINKGLIPLTQLSVPKRGEFILILKLGIPAGLQMMAITGGVMAIMSVVTSFGKDVVAGFGAAQRLDSVIMLPAMALGTAVNSMAGQNIGAKQMNRVHKIAFYAMIYNLVIMFIVAVFIVFLAQFCVKLFIQDKHAVEFGTKYLQTIAFFYPFLGINFVLNGIVRASGAMIQVLVLNIISFWVLRYPLTLLFSGKLGDNGIAYGMGVSFVISSIIAFLYYRYGKWDQKFLFNSNK